MPAKPKKTAAKFAVVRLYRGKFNNVVGESATLAAAKACAAREMGRYNDYDYAIYTLVGQIVPVVPEVRFIPVEGEGGSVSS